MKAAVPLLIAGTAVFLCLGGCATALDSPIQTPCPTGAPLPLRIAVLPPRIHPSLMPANLEAETTLWKQLLDGRGLVVTSANASRDIGLALVSTLTQAGRFERVFLAADRQEAEQLGADGLLAVTVRDYRTVLLGANGMGVLMVPTSLLCSQYWMRWRTIEARFDWDAYLISLASGETLYHRRLELAYTSPVRSARGEHFTNKMLSYLQNRAAPDFIGELFSQKMMRTSQAAALEK